MDEHREQQLRSFVIQAAKRCRAIDASMELAPANRAYVVGTLCCAAEIVGDESLSELAEEHLGLLAGHAVALVVSPGGGALWASHWPFAKRRHQEARAQLVAAGETLAKQFQQREKYFGLECDPGSLRIDVMTATPCVFYAAEETLEQDLGRRATQHSRTTRDTLVRADGVVLHAATIDPTTGNVIAKVAHGEYQNAAAAMQGFCDCFAVSNQREFLAVSERVADWWLKHLPTADTMKLVGAETGPAAFLSVARQASDNEKKKAYQHEALRLLEVLATPETIEADGDFANATNCYHLVRAIALVMTDD